MESARTAVQRLVYTLLVHANVPAQMQHFRVSNIVCCCECGFEVDIRALADAYTAECEYKGGRFPGLNFALPRPAVTFTVFVSGRCNISGVSSEREAQTCWTWFYTRVLTRFRRASLSRSVTSASYRASTERRQPRFAASSSSSPLRSNGGGNRTPAASPRGVNAVHAALAPLAAAAAAAAPSRDELHAERHAGVWRRHSLGACPCIVRVAPNDYGYYEHLAQRAELELQQQQQQHDSVLREHVDAGCIPMPCTDEERCAALKELAHACRRQMLVVSEGGGSGGGGGGGGDEAEPHVWIPQLDARAVSALRLLRGI